MGLKSIFLQILRHIILLLTRSGVGKVGVPLFTRIFSYRLLHLNMSIRPDFRRNEECNSDKQTDGQTLT